MAARNLETWALVALLAVHVLLGIYYAASIPIWEAHDEIGHYYFVRYVATQHRLPSPGQQLVPENDESRQPPLYYLLTAIPVALLSPADDIVPHLNPHMSWPRAEGGSNRVIHDPMAERWPYRGTVLAVHVSRWMSVALGACGLLFTFLTARQAFPAQPWVRWGAVAIHALWPQYRFATAVINNDLMVTVAAGLVIWLLVRAVTVRQPGTFDALAVASATGLALLSKNSALALLPVVALVLAASVIRSKPAVRGRVFAGLAGGALLGLAAVGWWYARNIAGGTGMFGGSYSLSVLKAFLSRALLGHANLRWELVRPALRAGLFSLWAAFGWNNVTLPLQTYSFAALWAAAGLLGLLAWCLRRPPRSQAAAVGTLLLVTVSMVGTWLFFAVGGGRIDLPGRYILPALPALSVLLSVGWNALLPGRARAFGWATMAAALALLALTIPGRCIRPTYAAPPQLTEAQLSAYTPIRATFGDFAELVAYRIDGRFVQPGDRLHVTLVWRVLAQTQDDYSLAVQLFGPGRQLIGEVHRFPGRGALATTTWQPQSLFAEEVAVQVPVEGGEPARLAWIEVSYYNRHNVGVPIAVRDADGRDVGASVRLGQVKIRRAPQPHPPLAPSLGFGQAIGLIGGNATLQLAGQAPALDIDLHWASTAQQGQDYTISVQLRDEQESIVAHFDSPPQRGRYPTSFWEPGESIQDSCTLTLPAQLPAGLYTLYVCMYDPATLDRLPVTDPQGQHLIGREARLLTIHVAEGEVRLQPAYPWIHAQQLSAGAVQGL